MPFCAFVGDIADKARTMLHHAPPEPTPAWAVGVNEVNTSMDADIAARLPLCSFGPGGGYIVDWQVRKVDLADYRARLQPTPHRPVPCSAAASPDGCSWDVQRLGDRQPPLAELPDRLPSGRARPLRRLRPLGALARLVRRRTRIAPPATGGRRRRDGSKQRRRGSTRRRDGRKSA